MTGNVLALTFVFDGQIFVPSCSPGVTAGSRGGISPGAMAGMSPADFNRCRHGSHYHPHRTGPVILFELPKSSGFTTTHLVRGRWMEENCTGSNED